MKTTDVESAIFTMLDHVDVDALVTVSHQKWLAKQLASLFEDFGYVVSRPDSEATNEQIDKFVARNWVATPGEFREALKEAFEIRVRD